MRFSSISHRDLIARLGSRDEDQYASIAAAFRAYGGRTERAEARRRIALRAMTAAVWAARALVVVVFGLLVMAL